MASRTAALASVADDLRRIFGTRLEALVAYGWRHSAPVPSLALVQSLELADLNACASHVARWHRSGAATPLILTRSDFSRSLDAFPIEYGEIIADHEVVIGTDPFEGLSIRPEDLRRACEVQAKSHLLHLREDYVEGGARPSEIDALVRESVPGLIALLRHLARLDEVSTESAGALAHYASHRIGLDARSVGDLLAVAQSEGVDSVDTVKLFPEYLAAAERLAEFVDQWRAV